MENYEKTNNVFGKTMVAFLAGIAAGTALGVLFAPNKGSETRRKIEGTARDFADRVKETAEEGMESLSDLGGKRYEKTNVGGKTGKWDK